MKNTYDLHIAGLTRCLSVVPISSDLAIASFVMLGDTQLVEKCAQVLAEKIKGLDVELLVCPEAKAIPLTHAMARIMNLDYVVIRKTVKGYMEHPVVETVHSITTTEEQTLVLDGTDAEKIRGRRVCLIDDVVSTGASLKSTAKILNQAQAIVVAQAAALLEEGGYDGKDVIYLEKLPVFPL